MEDQESHVRNFLLEMGVAAVVFLLVVSLIGAYLTEGFGWYGGIVDWFRRLWFQIGVGVAVLVVILDIVLIGFIVTILQRFFELSPRLPLFIVPGEGPRKARAVPIEKEVSEEWRGVKNFARSQNPSEWNMAVLRADALLDDVLQHMGHEGNTVKERLDLVDPTQLVSLDRVLSAHRLRNMIAHDPMIQHTKETIDQALASYERAFKELGVLKEEKTEA